MNDRCKYHYLYNYCTHTRIDIKDYTKIGLDSNPSNATILTLHTAYKAQKLEVTLANGLNYIIESRDRQRQAKLDRESQNNIKQQSIDSLLIITLINGGYKGKLWGFRENSEDGITILNPKKDFMGAETIRTNIQKSTPQRNKQVHLLFYGGARKINAAFYLSFIANQDSLSNEYLQARKALYKTYQLIKQEQAEELQRSQEELEQQLQGLDSKERESKLQEIQREQERELREKQRQVRTNKRNANNTNNLILESNDKNNVIIFLDSANSLSNLIHIHNERIDIFTKDSTRLDIQELESLINKYNDSFRDFNNTESNPIHNTQSDNDNIESKTNNPESNNQESKLTLDSLHSANTQIFLYSQLLLGSSETPNNPLFFGELDSKGEFRESKPIYHLIGETDYDTKDSKESFTQTLQIFLNNSTLTILNYSLLDSSLNIKLESKSKESKEILEKEQTQREQKEQDSKTQSPQSTSMLHPILEDNEIKCPHNGIVKLKAICYTINLAS